MLTIVASVMTLSAVAAPANISPTIVSPTTISNEPSWTIQTIGRTANGNRGISTRLADDGRIHAVFTGCSDAKCNKDDLFYAVRSAEGQWSLGPIDRDKKGNTGWSVSSAVDAQGLLHVFYNNHYKYPVLRHASRPLDSRAEPSQGWTLETVSKSSGGDWTSAAVSTDGIVVANTAYPTNNIDKSVLDVSTLEHDGHWRHETIDDSFGAGFFTSTVVGADGQPYVLYNSGKYPDGDLNIAHRGFDGKWTLDEVDHAVVKHSALVDEKGFLHLAYNKDDDKYMKTRDLWYATNAPDGRWHRELIEGGEYSQQDTGHFPALRRDAHGGMHIVYEDNFHEKVMYARNLGDGWKLSEITRNKQDGYYASFVIDHAGAIHLLYDNGFELRYARCADCAAH